MQARTVTTTLMYDVTGGVGAAVDVVGSRVSTECGSSRLCFDSTKFMCGALQKFVECADIDGLCLWVLLFFACSLFFVI